MTEVFERVLLGNRRDAENLDLFNQQNIGLVINVTDNISNYFEGLTHVKRRVLKEHQTDEMKSLSQSSNGEVIFDSEGRNITPTKKQESQEPPLLLFDDEESNSSMCDTPMCETLFTTTTTVSDYLVVPSQVSDSSDLSSVPSDPMLTFDDENSIMSTVSASENDPLLNDQTSMSSVISNSSQTPQKSQDDAVFATPKSKSKKTPKKSSQKKERKQVAKVFEYVKLNHPVMYHKISIEDSHEVNISEYFDEAISKIATFLENNPDKKVMIHCREGKSRSVSTLIAYGMKSLKLSLNDCYKHVTKELDGNDRINNGFKGQLMEYELQLLKARARENPEIQVVNSYTFFEKRGRGGKKNYVIEESRDDDEDVDYDDEDDFEEDDDDEDDEDGDYEEKKRKPKKKTGGRKKKGPQFAKDWKDIDIQESKPQKGKQLSLFDMFAKKNKPAPTIATEPAQPSKQATLDSLFSPKKPKKSSTKKSSSARKLDFDNLPQEATIPETKETSNNIEPIVLSADDNMDTTDDIKTNATLETKAESSVSTSEIEKSEVKDGKKKKKEKEQNKSTKKVFKRTPRLPTPEEPVVVEEPKKKKEETKKRKKTEESESKTESKKKKTKKEKSKKDKKETETATSETAPTETKSSDENPAQPTAEQTTSETAPTSTEPVVVEEKPKKVEKPKTGGLFKYFKPKAVATTQ